MFVFYQIKFFWCLVAQVKAINFFQTSIKQWIDEREKKTRKKCFFSQNQKFFWVGWLKDKRRYFIFYINRFFFDSLSWKSTREVAGFRDTFEMHGVFSIDMHKVLLIKHEEKCKFYLIFKSYTSHFFPLLSSKFFSTVPGVISNQVNNNSFNSSKKHVNIVVRWLLCFSQALDTRVLRDSIRSAVSSSHSIPCAS